MTVAAPRRIQMLHEDENELVVNKTSLTIGLFKKKKKDLKMQMSNNHLNYFYNYEV